MRLPHPRGPIGTAVLERLRGGPMLPVDLTRILSSLDHEDLQLALWVLYELHYRGFEDVDDDLEWDPELLRVRAALERIFERDLRALAASVPLGEGPIVETLHRLAATDLGPSLARYLHREATHEQFREFLVQRSIYHLKESDPHAWALPRATGQVKVALTEILYDEFGAGRPERLHSALFARTLVGLGLSCEYGEYLDQVPAPTLAVNNAMSFFGLHRRLRGAILGHLAAFEATSSIPNRRYSQGAVRLGYDDAVRDYFDEHVEADAVHEQIALRDICDGLVLAEPDLRADVLLGAAVCVQLDALAGTQMMDSWRDDVSSLRSAPARHVA